MRMVQARMASVLRGGGILFELTCKLQNCPDMSQLNLDSVTKQ